MLTSSEFLFSFLLVSSLLLMSIIEVAFSNASRISVRRLLDNPQLKFAPQLAALIETRSEVLMSIQLLNQMLLTASGIVCFTIFDRLQLRYVESVPMALVLVFVIILLFRQLIPRLIAARNPEMVLLRLFPFLRLSNIAMKPFSGLLTAVLNYFHRWEETLEPDKEEEASEEEIQAFIDAGQEEGILEHDEGEMIQSIVQFGDKVVREVMTPRTHIVAIDINAPLEKLVQMIISRRHARIPVYRDDLDNIEGVIHERDILRLWQRGEKLESLRPLVSPVHFVPDTKPVADLLHDMKEKGEQVVLVVDEYGSISGLITLEDLVEEILGDIHDRDSDGEKIIEESRGVFIVPGSMELGALDQVLGVPFVENTECTTVAGAVVELFGRLPSGGEKLEHNGISVEILDADRRRVHRLRMRNLTPQINDATQMKQNNA